MAPSPEWLLRPPIRIAARRAYDEPQGYSALLSMFFLCDAVRGRRKVVLAGDGGDEVFGGYGWYGDLGQPPSRRARLGRRFQRLRVGASPQQRVRAAEQFARSSALHRHAWRLFPRFLPEEAEALLAPTALRFDDDLMLAPLRAHFEEGLPLKRALQRVDLLTFCCDSILAKVDRASMAHSLEVRVPLLDRRVVEWGLQRPLRAEPLKAPLREYLRSRVPPEVLERPKQGFSLRVLGSYDWDRAIEEIAAGPWVRDGFFAAGWREFLRPGVPFREARVWTLLGLTRWGERWLDGAA